MSDILGHGPLSTVQIPIWDGAKWVLVNGPGNTITTAALSTQQNDFNPTGWSDATLLRIQTNGSAQTITGFYHLNVNQTRKVLVNIMPVPITLAHLSGSSGSTNQIASPTGQDLILYGDTAVLLEYEAGGAPFISSAFGQNKWRIVAYSTSKYSYNTITPPQITGDQTTYTPTGWATADIARLTTDASHNITGFGAPDVFGTIPHIRKTIHNVGTQNFVIKHAGNVLAPGSVDRTVTPNSTTEILWDAASGAWRVLY